MANSSTQQSVDSLSTLSEQLKAYFSTLDEKFDSIILENVENYYQQVMENTIPILAALLFCWIVYQAIHLMYAKADAKKLTLDFFKFFLILTLIGSWADVYHYIGEPVIYGIPELVGSMVGQSQSALIYSFATLVFDEIYKGFSSVSSGGVLEIAFVLPVVGVYLVVMLLAIVAIGLYFLVFLQCKLILALMIITAPIFIGCAMFDSTKNFFNNWVALIFNQFLTLLLLALATQLIMGVIPAIYKKVFPSEVATFASAIGMALSLFVTLVTFAKMPSIASSLASSGFGITSTGVGNVMSAAKKFFTKGLAK